MPVTTSSKPSAVAPAAPSSYPVITEHPSKHTLGPSQFNFISQIGKGGFGVVYLAEKVSPPSTQSSSTTTAQKSYLAIKTVSKQECMTTQSEQDARKLISQLKNERNILASLDHPFCVSLEYFFQDTDRLYFAMSLAESGDFFQLITEENYGNGLDLHAARFYAAELALALTYIHEDLGLVYRDLKPENVMLTGDGHIMITDFGLSRPLSRLQRANSTVGTPAYFAPEIVMQEKYDTSVDWWAYGVVVFELICGKEPFRGREVVVTMKNIIQKEPKLPSLVAGRCSKGEFSAAQNFIDKLLAKTPSERLGANGGHKVMAHKFFHSSISTTKRGVSVSSDKLNGDADTATTSATAAWTWDALYRKEIPAPIVRQNILETPSMKALMQARRQMQGVTKLEEEFDNFEDYDKGAYADGDEAEQSERKPSFSENLAAMPEQSSTLSEESSAAISPRTPRTLPPITSSVSPMRGSKEKRGGGGGDASQEEEEILGPSHEAREEIEGEWREYSNLTRALEKTAEDNIKKFPKLAKFIDTTTPFAQQHEVEEEQQLEGFSDPVLRVVKYEFRPGNLAILEKEGQLQNFGNLFREQATGYIHFDYKVEGDTLTLNMVFMNHWYLERYTKFAKESLVELIRPYLAEPWGRKLRREASVAGLEEKGGGGTFGDMLGMARPSGEKLIWMKAKGSEGDFAALGELEHQSKLEEAEMKMHQRTPLAQVRKLETVLSLPIVD
jgi:serine/threonine protein kinase